MDVLATNLRVAALSITLFDYIQTLPGEFDLYRRAYEARRLSLVVFFFVVSRYMGAIALVTNCIGYFSTSFTIGECHKFHLVPPLTKLVAGLAAQGVIFLRTYAISRRSKVVGLFLSGLTILCLPPQVVGNVYLRYPSVSDGNCTSRVNTDAGDYHTGYVYYLANLVFDVSACVIATFCIWKQSGGNTMSQFTRRILRHGVIYAAITTVANLLCLLALLNLPVVRGLGSTLSIAVTLIMCQHLVLATHQLSNTSERPSSEDDDIYTVRQRGISEMSRRMSHGRPQQKFELSGIRVHTETIHHADEARRPHSIVSTADSEKQTGFSTRRSSTIASMISQDAAHYPVDTEAYRDGASKGFAV